MSRTDLDPATLANALRGMAGDGSMEWVHEPIQARVLLDVADMLDENAELRNELESVGTAAYLYGRTDLANENAKLREYITKLEQTNIVLDSDNTELRNDMRDMQMFVSENAKLRELVRDMFYAIHPCDRAQFLANVAELGVEVDE